MCSVFRMISLGMFSRVHRTYKEKKGKEKKDETKKTKDDKTEEKSNEASKDSPRVKKVANLVFVVLYELIAVETVFLCGAQTNSKPLRLRI